MHGVVACLCRKSSSRFRARGQSDHDAALVQLLLHIEDVWHGESLWCEDLKLPCQVIDVASLPRAPQSFHKVMAAHSGMQAFLVAEHTDALSPDHGLGPATLPFLGEARDVPLVRPIRYASAHDTLRFMDPFLTANALQQSMFAAIL